MKRRAFLTTAAATLASPMSSRPDKQTDGRRRLARRCRHRRHHAARGRSGWRASPRARSPRRVWRSRCRRRRWLSKTPTLAGGHRHARPARAHRRLAAAWPSASPAHGLCARAAAPRASHTHCGPVIDAADASPTTSTRRNGARFADYTDDPRAADRRADRRGAAARWRRRRSTWARPRHVRRQPPRAVLARRARRSRVPILRVDVAGAAARHRLRLCLPQHHAAADEVEFHGDYAGVAQAEIERAPSGRDGAVRHRLRRRRQPQAARHAASSSTQHGEALADAVDRALPRRRRSPDRCARGRGRSTCPLRRRRIARTGGRPGRPRTSTCADTPR